MILASPPSRETYRFVLRETRHNPEVAQTFVAYDEAADSRCIRHPDGVVACTLFLFSEHSRDRATKLGWDDVTEPWLRGDAGAAPRATYGEEAPPEPAPTSSEAATGAPVVREHAGPSLSPRRRAG